LSEEQRQVAEAAGVTPDPPEEVVRALSRALKAAHFYPPEHDRVLDSRSALQDAVSSRLAGSPSLELVVRGDGIEADGRACDGLEAGTVSSAMRRRSIRAIAFRRGVDAEALAALVTLLHEAPLDLTARGGAAAAAEGLVGIGVTTYRYQVDRDGEPVEEPPAGGEPPLEPGDGGAWDLASTATPAPARAETTLRAPREIEEIPEVRAELERIHEELRRRTGDDLESRRTVDSILRIVLDRVLRAEGDGADGGTGDGDNLWDLDEEGAGDRERVNQVADRIYGIVLAQQTLQGHDEPAAWAPSEKDPELHPVDPRRLRRTCAAIDALPSEPDRNAGEGLAAEGELRLAETAVNLVPLCVEAEGKEAILGRLAAALGRSDDEEEHEASLRAVADLMLSAELDEEDVAVVLEVLRPAVAEGRIAGVLLERLDRHPAARARRVAENLDDVALRRILEVYLRGRNLARTAASRILRLRPDFLLIELLPACRHPDSGRRLRALELARSLEDAKASSILVELASDANDHVRLAALRALAQRPEERAREAFDEALASCPAHVWRALARHLAGSGDLRVPRFLESIVRSNGERRWALKDRLLALRTLARLPGASGRQRLVALSRFFSLKNPVASLLIRTEARKILRTSSSAPLGRMP
jgi:hypothetical protein